VQEQVSKVTEQVTAHTVNGTETVAAEATEKTATTARAARNVAKS
jgi:hypothetical protein